MPRKKDPVSDPKVGDYSETRWGVVTDSDPEQWIILPSGTLDQQDAGLICATHNNALEGPRDISVGAVINEGLQPFVEMTLGSESVQMTIPQARLQLRILQEQTEAAISEAILLMFIDGQLRVFRKEYEDDGHTDSGA